MTTIAVRSGTVAFDALAAMHMGASAVKAVEIAIKVDKNSGPPVSKIDLADITAPRR